MIWLVKFNKKLSIIYESNGVAVVKRKSELSIDVITATSISFLNDEF